MASGFPDSITQPTAFAFLNSYYPYSQRITVRLNDRSVAVQKAELFIQEPAPAINTVTAGQILTNPDGTLSVLTAGLFSTAATVFVPTKGLLILEDGRITTTTPGLLMHPAGSNLVPSAGLLLHADGTISIPEAETSSDSSGSTSDALSDLYLHPEGTNYYSVQFYTGATVSSLSHPGNSATTASLTIRSSPGATDALYSVTTVNSLHQIQGSELYYFTFVVSQPTLAVRDLCRSALPSRSVPFVAEIKLEQSEGRTFTSKSFPITCFIPVIRSEQF
jgi:hypothetical protein